MTVIILFIIFINLSNVAQRKADVEEKRRARERVHQKLQQDKVELDFSSFESFGIFKLLCNNYSLISILFCYPVKFDVFEFIIVSSHYACQLRKSFKTPKPFLTQTTFCDP